MINIQTVLHFLSGQWLMLQMPWHDATIVSVPEVSEAEVFHNTIMKDI